MKRRVLALWTILALGLTMATWIITINRPFGIEFHAWASAHMAVMARSFSQQGVIRLRGVPIQNNPPLGNQPDHYIHWPPLFAILLGLAFKVFGDSPLTAHVFVIFLNLIYLAALFKLVKHCFGAQIAMLSLFGVVTLPVFFQYSTLVWTVNAGVISILLALYCFLCATENGLNWKWAWAGMAAVAVGTLLSWEPILLGFALFGIALLLKSRDGIRAALAYVASGVLTLALILVGYATASPELRGDLWATISVRLGGNYQPQSVPIHALFDRMWYVGQPWDRWSLFGRALLLIGPVGLLATVGVLLWAWDRRNERKSPCFALGGLIGVWLGWFVVFPNHVYIHDYQWLLGAPLAGIAIGICLNAAGERFHGALCWLPLAAIPALLLVPLATEALHLNDLRGLHSGIVEYGLAIKENTPNTAVILSNSPSMVPVYYSDRHTLRYVDNEETLRIINREIWNIFPGSDVYLAITPDYAPRFPCALANFPTMGRTPNLLLLKMSADSCR